MPKKTEYKDNEEIEKTEEENIEKENEAPISEDEQKLIIDQINDEYPLGYKLTVSKREKDLKRLKLFNNQKKDQSKVGDPLLFTVFMTVLASVYEDKLSVEFRGKEEGDAEVAENLNSLAEHDHRLMKKDETDYNWDWDAAFFGRGFLLLNDFDRRAGRMCPVSEIVDPMVLFRDPEAVSVNGDQKGNGALRFWGREIGLTKSKMEKHSAYFNLEGLKKSKDIKSIRSEASKARKEAKGLQVTDAEEEALTENYEYGLLEWWTHYKGKKVLVVLAESRKKMVRFQYLKGVEGKDMEEWPLQDRVIYPMAHDWDGVSIPDLIEDKQRAKAVLINLGLDSARLDINPMYLFNKRKIKNTNDLKFGFNKFIPVAGDVNNTIAPVQKSLFHSQVNLILQILDTAAQKAVAAPEVAQGVQPRQDRTLGETQEIMVGVNKRNSLSARIFGWSERRFWEQWYFLYKKYFKSEIDEKIIRLEGPLNPIWRSLTRENIIAKIDPDVIVESKAISEFNRRKKFQEFSAFTQIVIQDPTTNRRYVNRKMGRILGMRKGELTLMFPPTIDEMNAEVENQQLNENKFVPINPYDDDIVHIEIHNKAADKKAKISHIEGHRLMMMKKKENPELFPQLGEQPMPGFSPVSQPGRAEGSPTRRPTNQGQVPAGQGTEIQ